MRVTSVRGRRRYSAWCQRLSISTEQLCAWGNTSWDCRYGDKSCGARRRDRLKDTFLIHTSTILALAARSTLVTTASYLEIISFFFLEHHVRHKPFSSDNTDKQLMSVVEELPESKEARRQVQLVGTHIHH